MSFSASQQAIVPAISGVLAATIARLIVERNYPPYRETKDDENLTLNPPKYLTCSGYDMLDSMRYYKNCKSKSRQANEKFVYTFILFLIITAIFIKSGAENYAGKALRSIGFSQKRSKKQKKSRRRKTRKQ